MRWRRDRDDNADLSDEEYAWWTGRDRRKEAGTPPDGMPERRAVEVTTVAAPAPPPPPPPPARAPAPAPEPAPPVVSLPPLVAVTPEPPATFPFERDAAGASEGADVGPERDPVADPWHRSTSPQALAAYRTLGIDWEASWDEVVEVFRDHAALWHPDRLAGTDPLVQAEGQRRMSEMNRAYAELRRMLRPSRRELFTA